MRAAGQLERAISEITIGVHQGAKLRAHRLADTHTGEWEQQVQVPFSGDAANGWASTDVPVNWEFPFVYAPDQRLAPFATPHFTHGIEFQNTPSDVVIATASVLQWSITEEQWYVGALVRLAVGAPNSSVAVPYQAVAHLRFQGYAAYAEGDEF